MNSYSELIALLQDSQRVLITSHYSPDGDALGSMAGLACALGQLGKEVRLYNQGPVPENLGWFKLPVRLEKKLMTLKAFDPDILIVLDCGDEGRTGAVLGGMLKDKPTMFWPNITVVNIDHHLDNPNFGDINIVNPNSPATAFIVGEILEEMGVELSGPVGLAIYLGIYTDTGGFSYPSTHADVFDMAGRIVRNGLNIREFTENLTNNWSLNRMRLWGKLWGEIELCANGTVAISVIPQDYFDLTSTDSEDLDSYASFIRRLKGVRAVLMLRERSNGSCKASFRSDGIINVQNVAQQLGGGGHKAAAGVDSLLRLEDFVKRAKELLEAQVLADLEPQQ